MLRQFFSWAVSNSPAMNVLMAAIIIVGVICGLKLRRETFPEFDIEQIMVSVPYPGATPEEVENGICQKIEEALQSLEGVRKITSTASEGAAMVLIELRSSVKNVDRVLNEAKDAVDRIRPQFPDLVEPPIVQRMKMQETIISIGVLGPDDGSEESALALRQIAENLREELLQYPRISLVNLVGTKDYQIDIEIPENTLRSYHLTLGQAANIVRAENIQTPGGTIRAPSQEINVRTDNRRYDGQGIGELPFITSRDGTVIKVNEIANIRDEFIDGTALATVYMPPETGIPDDVTSISGRRVISLDVLRNTNEDLLAMVDNVYEFIEQKNRPGILPEGYSLVSWGDHSVEVRERLQLLLSNGVQGLLIVFILLVLFLEMKLAFWVAMGIPFAICATSLWLYLSGFTLNMMSTFGIIMGLGIVVDDSIVAGENIYTHRHRGKNYLRAAIDGITEVFPSIFASVLTTIIAFFPLLYVAGMLGKIIYSIPVVMVVMLLASLGECVAILPCHLAHRKNLFLQMLGGYFYIFSWLLIPFRWFSRYTDWAMDMTTRYLYGASIVWVLRNRSVFIVGCLCTFAVTLALVFSGTLPFVILPKMDGNSILVTVSFPNGTPEEVTDQWTRHIEQSFWQVAKEYEKSGTPIAVRSFRVVGMSLATRGGNMAGVSGDGNGYQGGVHVELIDGNKRTVSSMEIIERWRKVTGAVPGADKLTFETQTYGPPGGAVEFLLVAKSSDAGKLESAVEECKAYLAEMEGTQDITDSDMPGKYEFRLKIKDSAMAMGLHPEDLANVIRATYYGVEVQRLQRGRHEVKVMVCYPREDRRSLGDFNEIRLRTATGEYPITELADIDVVRGYTTITRRNQQRSITVSADVDENRVNARTIIAVLKSEFLPKLQQKYPGVMVLWEGHEEELNEAADSMMIGFSLAMCAMFIALTIQFRSYLQPLIIMAIIPFGLTGAAAAHLLFGEPLTLFSLFGLVALSGIIVNDSIVMIDFINRKIHDGAAIRETLIMVGQNRFRPIVLTSVTTIGGLLPIVMETSFQAKMIIPMALSIAGGVAFALILVLYFVPVLYSYYADFFVPNMIKLEHAQTDTLKIESIDPALI
ncbi:MAG: efflux RND transporter permease subunit [Planctomycetaceae bacterium]|jgi:multidrug efflux pump subunit AcrB|nr:efflux RND transporter permease subunit [Planctomycetaceae bacterium]